MEEGPEWKLVWAPYTANSNWNSYSGLLLAGDSRAEKIS